jgi:hypothetical protein
MKFKESEKREQNKHQWGEHYQKTTGTLTEALP